MTPSISQTTGHTAFAGHHSPFDLLTARAPAQFMAQQLESLSRSYCAAGQALAQTPFDTMRAQYASAARFGIIRKSMLASRDFEKTVGALERLMLGPLARHV